MDKVTRPIGVSGASGLLGSELLYSGSEQNLGWLPFSARDLDWRAAQELSLHLRASRVRQVLHLGWVGSGTNSYKFSELNSSCRMSTINLARACLEQGLHFFGVGSVAEFSSDTPYAVEKKRTHDALAAEIESGVMTWIRPYFVFFPGRWPKLISQLERQQPKTIFNNAQRDYIHLSDVATGITTSLSESLTGEIELGSGVLRRTSQLLESLGIPYIVGDSQANDELSAVANNLSLLELGWQPSLTDEILGISHG